MPVFRTRPRWFDAEYYLRRYPDVAASGFRARAHYDRIGWREGRDPSPLFSTRDYVETYEDVLRSGENPLRHFLTHGLREGRTGWLHLARGEAFGERIAGLAAAEAEAEADTRTETGLGDAALLRASAWFSAPWVARLLGQEGDRAALVAAWLGREPADRPDPHPGFLRGFYRDAYLGGAAEPEPLLHFLREGEARGLYPNPVLAERDIAAIRASGLFDAERWAASRGAGAAEPPDGDPVRAHVLSPDPAAERPAPGFDGRLVRALMPVEEGPAGAPFAHWLRQRGRPWAYRNLAELGADYDAVAGTDLFDAAAYASVARIDPARVDAVLHYLVRGVRLGLPASVRFHTGDYLRRYPDLLTARINPLVHYLRHGRAEGRQAAPHLVVPPVAAMVRPGGRARRAGAPALLVVSHEASQTGAPIVALNIARAFAESHDVTVWLGRDGPLSPEFAAASVEVATGFPPPADAGDLLARLVAPGRPAFAIVNSFLSGPALEPLRLQGVPVLLLVHDFATYVHPKGALSRLVLHADVAVFPARVVAEAVAEELRALGAAERLPHVRIAPQGHNDAATGEAGAFTAEGVRARIGAVAGPDLRIVLGAGWVQPRKGVDLFLQTAARLLAEAPGLDWRFVWVGGNYRPEEDLTTSVWLADHVARAGLAGRVTFFDEQPDLEPFWEVADVFFLSSRLDPYPNVALDALARGVPVVCFQGATGIAELVPAFGAVVRAAAFADPAAAAGAIAALGADPGAVRAAFAALGPALSAELSFATYAGRIAAYGAEAVSRAAERAALAGRLLARPGAELRALRQAVPGWARLTEAGEKGAIAAELAGLMAAGGPVPPVRVAEGEPLEVPAPGPFVRPARMAALAPLPGAALLHLHGPDAEALARFLAGCVRPPGLALALSAVRPAGIGRLAGEGVVALEAPVADGLRGLAALLDRGAPPLLGHGDLSAAPAALVRRLLDPAFAGIARAEAAADPALAAALPDWQGAGGDGASGVPPFLTGFFVRDVLSGFLAAAGPDLAAWGGPGAAARVAAALAAHGRRHGLGVVVVPPVGTAEEALPQLEPRAGARAAPGGAEAGPRLSPLPAVRLPGAAAAGGIAAFLRRVGRVRTGGS